MLLSLVYLLVVQWQLNYILPFHLKLVDVVSLLVLHIIVLIAVALSLA